MIGVAGSLLLAGAIAAAVKIHDHVEAETLLHDVIDELRLARASLAELDAQWQRNPQRSDAIISLTTIPSRLPLIGLTLKSLMRQKLAPARIMLNLPRVSRREKVAYEPPAFLVGLRSVSIRWCEDDLGPATKLLPSLRHEAAETRIIVVDDDRVYPPNLVGDLVAASDAAPHTAFSMRGWVVPADLTDRATTLWSKIANVPPAPVRARSISAPVPVDIVMGVSGYLVKPAFFDLAGVMDYAAAPREAFYVDDVWISAHLKVPRIVLPARHVSYQPKYLKGAYDRTALANINRGPGPDHLRNNTVVIRHFPQRWMLTSGTAAAAGSAG